MKIIREVSEIKKIHNWFIVDVGYSNGRKSCGVVLVRNNEYTEKKDVVFSGMKEEFQKFYDECKNENIGLILEAPLSIYFDKDKEGNDANPLGRKFEKETKTIIEEETGKQRKETKVRYWYSGPGATVTLGALEFINRIKKTLGCNNIYLFEGFVSFKKDDINKKDPHYEDAELLYDGIKYIKNNLKCENEFDGENYTFIGNYLNLEINGIPPIVKISKDKGEKIFEIFML